MEKIVEEKVIAGKDEKKKTVPKKSGRPTNESKIKFEKTDLILTALKMTLHT